MTSGGVYTSLFVEWKGSIYKLMNVTSSPNNGAWIDIMLPMEREAGNRVSL